MTTFFDLLDCFFLSYLFVCFFDWLIFYLLFDSWLLISLYFFFDFFLVLSLFALIFFFFFFFCFHKKPKVFMQTEWTCHIFFSLYLFACFFSTFLFWFEFVGLLIFFQFFIHFFKVLSLFLFDQFPAFILSWFSPFSLFFLAGSLSCWDGLSKVVILYNGEADNCLLDVRPWPLPLTSVTGQRWCGVKHTFIHCCVWDQAVWGFVCVCVQWHITTVVWLLWIKVLS